MSRSALTLISPVCVDDERVFVCCRFLAIDLGVLGFAEFHQLALASHSAVFFSQSESMRLAMAVHEMDRRSGAWQAWTAMRESTMLRA